MIVEMAAASYEGVMKLKEVRSLAVGHEGSVRAVRFNSDGNYCMTCGSDKTLRLSNPYKGTLLKTYIGHGYEVLDAVAANENDKIASCGTDKTVILWDVSTGKCIRKFKGHMGVCITPWKTVTFLYAILYKTYFSNFVQCLAVARPSNYHDLAMRLTVSDPFPGIHGLTSKFTNYKK